MNKIADINYPDCHMTVYYDNQGKHNRYRVYKEWNESSETGIKHRKHLLQKYGDLLSAIVLIKDYTMYHNEERR